MPTLSIYLDQDLYIELIKKLEDKNLSQFISDILKKELGVDKNEGNKEDK